MANQATLFNTNGGSNDTGSVQYRSGPIISPFRYPGGKTWLAPRLRDWFRQGQGKPRLLLEPFAGGASVSLYAVAHNLAEHARLVELDDGMAAFWQAILLGQGDWLAEQVLGFDMNTTSLRTVLDKPAVSLRERAFRILLVNRTHYGGIMAQGAAPIRDVTCRWYPETLAKRLRGLDLLVRNGRLSFTQGNGLDQLAVHAEQDSCLFFIDPPYSGGKKNAGSRLYNHHALDHDALFQQCQALKGDFLITYDDDAGIREMISDYRLEYRVVTMKTNHNNVLSELIVGRDLGWYQAS